MNNKELVPIYLRGLSSKYNMIKNVKKILFKKVKAEGFTVIMIQKPEQYL